MDLIGFWSFTLVYFVFVANCDKDWWKHTSIYEMYTRSFKDSNGDGTGDFNGITSKLEHLADIGIETIWLTPFYKSPMVDNGYDVQDFREIEPIFGTLEDFDKLLAKAHRLGLKIMIDFVPNHTSDLHKWFQKSIDRIEPYTNYYVWKPPKGYDENNNPIPPNNWISRFGGSGWTFNDKRKEFYYHMFGSYQPDLNYWNPTVRQEMLDVIRFWFKRGVDAVRYDATPFLLEDPQFRDEPHIYDSLLETFDSLIYTRDLRASYELLHEWRTKIDEEFLNKDGNTRLFVPEAYASLEHTMEYYDKSDYKVVQFPFNYFFVTNLKTGNATEIRDLINLWIDNLPSNDSVANWSIENHDNGRIVRKYGREFYGVITVIITMLPGVACIYYGNEIAMDEPRLRPDQLQDTKYTNEAIGLIGRDISRTPMQWDDSINAGFSTNTPWLPMHSDYWKTNVQYEKEQTRSFYKTFKKLMQLRKTNTLKYGDLKTYVFTEWTFVFTRSLENNETIIVVTNLGSETEIFDLSSRIENLPKTLKVLVTTENIGPFVGDRVPSATDYQRMLTLRPKSAVVLTDKVEEITDELEHTTPCKEHASDAHIYHINYLLFSSFCILVVYMT